MHKYLVILWVGLWTVCAWAGEAAGNLAVLDLSAGEGVKASEARMIADRLETELIQTGTYTVLERRRMDEILTEQGFQQSGACDETSCGVQVGQLLGVDLIVTGSLGKVGSVYSLNIKMMDVGSGRILQSQAVDVEGDLSKVLTEGCHLLAGKLSSGAKPGEVSAVRSYRTWWIAGGAVLLAAAGVGTWLMLANEDDNVLTVNRTLQ